MPLQNQNYYMGNIHCMLRPTSDENDTHSEIYKRVLFYTDCFHHLAK